MSKITTYKTDKDGKTLKNKDGEKIVDRQIDDISFPCVDKVYKQLKADQKYGNSVANLFNAGATVKCQSLTRTALAEKNKDGTSKYSIQAVQKMGMDANLDNVNSRKFNPEKAAKRLAPTVAKISNDELAKHGIQRLSKDELAMLKAHRVQAEAEQDKASNQ